MIDFIEMTFTVRLPPSGEILAKRRLVASLESVRGKVEGYLSNGSGG